MKPNVFELWAAPGPFEEDSDRLMAFGQFVGAWDMESTWYDQSGGRRQGTGEWHFAWILGGRGVQDILFTSGAPPHQVGTTLRCYDQALDAWHVAWMQPASGEFVHLLGRQVGDQIVLEGAGPDPRRRERWTFSA